MKTKIIRNWTFTFHRYLGLILGLLFILIGVTGSLLVFHHEIEDWFVTRQFAITPVGQPISAERAVTIVKGTYPNWIMDTLYFPQSDRQPYKLIALEPNANLEIADYKQYEVLVNPYTGRVMGDRREDFTFYRLLLNLHYRLFLPGEWTGRTITGIAALLMLAIAITGIILWPGWRKLSTGFKVKWNGRIKRRNFDLHKVIGIATAVFLAFTAFTGAYLSFYYTITPAIDALTPTVVSESVSISPPRPGQVSLPLDTLLQKAQQILPQMQLKELYFAEGEAFEVYGRGNESVWLDPYTAKVLTVEDGKQRQIRLLSDRIFKNLIVPLHFGTFGGLPTRILYVFVGLAPLGLFITGSIMWWYRKRSQN
jgi:uncharacterized iron-regulated membrane protein